jgi:hypothetical protein
MNSDDNALNQIGKNMHSYEATTTDYGIREKISYTVQSSWNYDTEHGQLIESLNGVIQEAIEVRKVMQDDMIRQALIFELEKLGYVIYSPDEGDPT